MTFFFFFFLFVAFCEHEITLNFYEIILSHITLIGKSEEGREGFGAKHLASFAALAGIGMRRQTGRLQTTNPNRRLCRRMHSSLFSLHSSLFSPPPQKLLIHPNAAARWGSGHRPQGMGREDPVRGSRASGEIR